MTNATQAPFILADTGGFSHWGGLFLQGFMQDAIPFVVCAGVLFLICYVFWRRRLVHRKVQPAFPASAEVRREILLSLQSIAIFAVTGVFFSGLYQLGWTQLYFRIDTYGWPYFFVSILLLILIQDSWFYWTHRFLHWGPIFKRVHHVHHRCHNPTPWAAFAFHPLEAFLNVLFFPLVMMIMPIHPGAAAIWLFYMFFITAYGHLGFELMPKGFTRHWLGRWSTTSTHHNLHHTDIQTNFGLYFTIWDGLMRTIHRDYDQKFDYHAGGRKDAGGAPRRKKRKPALRT